MTLTEYRLIAATAIMVALWATRALLLAQDRRFDRRHRLVAHYDAAARERIKEAERAAARAEAP